MKILNSAISFKGAYPQVYDNSGQYGPVKVISEKTYDLKVKHQTIVADHFLISAEAQNALAAEKAAETATVQDPALSKIEELTIRICQKSIVGGAKRLTLYKMKNRDAAGNVLSEQTVNYRNADQVSLAAKGIINTSDGKTIPFTSELNVSRDLAGYFANEASGTGDPEDQPTAQPTSPMVLNFDGLAKDLTCTRFSFDLDADGRPDQLSFLQNSGFLALDNNGDGVINDGRELFGNNAVNLNLGQYDSDCNGWIDENDPIFDKLRIWTKGQDGRDALFALGEKGIGAIYLGRLRLPLSENEASGSGVVFGGLYVKEDGTVGNMFQVERGRF